MILVLGLVVGLATVPLAGGSWRRLRTVRLSGTWCVVVAIIAQQIAPALHDGWIPRLVNVGSLLLAGVFLVANRPIVGAKVVLVGGALNLAAIVANGGVMPASPTAWKSSGAPHLSSHWFSNARPMAHTTIGWLGDVIRTPTWLPGSAPVSVGDLAIVVGFLVAVHHLCDARWTRVSRTEPAEVAQ